MATLLKKKTKLVDKIIIVLYALAVVTIAMMISGCATRPVSEKELDRYNRRQEDERGLPKDFRRPTRPRREYKEPKEKKEKGTKPSKPKKEKK